ncbi:uncharacterized protein B0H18DRAFT_875934 [Fomitopsis serialis]|uniref:uncharacterized protein n=1 Tax=Fomitopsis serialis TaxID=139415 RepID=UPI00200814EB|nr:uncharacterized protein B0H18DRAFT_875934 [Neoantrodia serialis]KAH9926924.1 hypothetical protein B0H18DRAFT_875934 [Neoantrodia serialis]
MPPADADDLDAKKSTHVVDFTPSTEVWYSDGSVVLVADKMAFRVHGTILATHCEVFRDMFAMPQPATPDANTETYEGCQVLRLQDSPVDMRHFLKTIYDFSYFRPRVRAKFPVVAAVLRLGTKYDAAALRQRAIDLLSTAYPNSGDAWRQRTIQRLVPPFENELAVYIELAIEIDIRAILPALYYAASKAPLPDVLSKLHNLAVAPSLQWDVCRTFIIGREKLLLAEQASALAFLQPDFSRPGCQNAANCAALLNLAAKRTLPKPGDAEPFYQWCLRSPDEVSKTLTLCIPCQGTVTTSIRSGRDRLWEQLPGFFGLPDWDTLRARDGLDLPDCVSGLNE